MRALACLLVVGAAALRPETPAVTRRGVALATYAGAPLKKDGSIDCAQLRSALVASGANSYSFLLDDKDGRSAVHPVVRVVGNQTVLFVNGHFTRALLPGPPGCSEDSDNGGAADVDDAFAWHAAEFARSPALFKAFRRHRGGGDGGTHTEAGLARALEIP